MPSMIASEYCLSVYAIVDRYDPIFSCFCGSNGTAIVGRRPHHRPEARCGKPERGFGGFNPELDGARQAPGAGLWGLRPVRAARRPRTPTTRRRSVRVFRCGRVFLIGTVRPTVRVSRARSEAQRVGWMRVLGSLRPAVALFSYACLRWFLGDRTIGSRHFNRAGFEAPCATVDTDHHACASGVGSHKR